jgi:hypothetical protein
MPYEQIPYISHTYCYFPRRWKKSKNPVILLVSAVDSYPVIQEMFPLRKHKALQDINKGPPLNLPEKNIPISVFKTYFSVTYYHIILSFTPMTYCGFPPHVLFVHLCFLMRATWSGILSLIRNNAVNRTGFQIWEGPRGNQSVEALISNNKFRLYFLLLLTHVNKNKNKIFVILEKQLPQQNLWTLFRFCGGPRATAPVVIS